MSSDNDDYDEDELLQIALKEQANRNTNYTTTKPSSSRLQPPPPPIPRKSKPNPNSTPNQTLQQQSQQRTKPRSRQQSIDVDDDDSEVELLSISSGDEDSSKDRGGGGRVSRSRGSRGSGAREEDKWDGGEPGVWKHVDEAELGRRVREMRETRAMPVGQSLEPNKVAPLGRKGLTHLQSFPRGMECVDPLGLGIIDNITLRLITESSESSAANKEHLGNSFREKLMYVSEKFDAKLFLSRIHQNTSAADLEASGLALKTDLKGRTQQKKRLVKENFDCFVSCKTTIDDIESKLRRIEEDPEGAGTAHLFKNIQSVSSMANRAFEPLFERQVQAEKIRSVQGMLQRFRTLFNLPSAIRGSISKGEYDLAVREYMKAKSIVLPSHVGILKRVLEEVEKVMYEFKDMLYKSMEDPEIDLTDLENTVRLLLELEPGSDPVWHYLDIQNRRIRGLLERCMAEHDTRMDALHNRIREQERADARWKQMQQDSNSSTDVDYSLILEDSHAPVNSHTVDLNGEGIDALRGRYIRRLTSVLIHQIPAFWKVVLSVFSGKFAKSSQVVAETSGKQTANKTDDKVGDVKYTSHSLDEVALMIRNTISAYELKVQNTFRELEESNILCPYMSDAIKEISKACQTLEGKESAPQSAVMTLHTLHSEITKIYIHRLCFWMRATTKELSQDESWIPVSILERNRSPYTISFLPLAFRTMMSSAMDQINLMIQSLRNEATKSEDMFEQLQEIQESVRLAFLNCFMDFAGYLDQIAEELSQIRSKKETSIHLENGYGGKISGLHPGSVVCDPHQKLLIVLSNIGYSKDELSNELYDKYTHLWHNSRERDEEDTDIQDLVTSFTALEEKILAHYTFAKANLIRTAAATYLLNAGIQWGGAPAVKGVRDAAVELLHTLVAVHAEVFSGAKPLLDKTLGTLVEGLIDTFLSLFYENKSQDFKSLDGNGFCQLMLELEYFETILNPHLTNEARDSLKSLQAVLLENATDSVTESENPGHHRRITRGSEDALGDDRQGMGVSPDDLLALAQQYSSELLQGELERTRINTACFMEFIPLDAVPEPVKSAYSSFRGSPMSSPSKNYRNAQPAGSPSFSRHRRR